MSAANRFDFNKCLAWEAPQWSVAHTFAKAWTGSQGLPDSVEWMEWDDPKGRMWQKRDVDVFAGCVPVSLKFRFEDFGDMLIELYSDMEEGKEGWGSTSRSHNIFYFTSLERVNRAISEPHPVLKWDVRVIDTDYVRRLVHSLRGDPEIQRLRDLSSWPADTYITKVNTREGEVQAIRIPTFIGGNLMWWGLCVAVPWDQIPHERWRPGGLISQWSRVQES